MFFKFYIFLKIPNLSLQNPNNSKKTCKIFPRMAKVLHQGHANGYGQTGVVPKTRYHAFWNKSIHVIFFFFQGKNAPMKTLFICGKTNWWMVNYLRRRTFFRCGLGIPLALICLSKLMRTIVLKKNFN